MGRVVLLHIETARRTQAEEIDATSIKANSNGDSTSAERGIHQGGAMGGRGWEASGGHGGLRRVGSFQSASDDS